MNTTLIDKIIIKSERDKYLKQEKDFIDDALIKNLLSSDYKKPDRERVEDIIQKSLSLSTLSPEECADLCRVEDPELLNLMEETALKVKKKVYDNRIVTFAPLYISSKCINNCVYCGFRYENKETERRILSKEEIVEECSVLAGKIGHKRIIAVYGEHPSTGADFIADTLNTIYSVKIPSKKGYNSIRRVNVNAAPLSISDLKKIKEAGIGTYQVFQETYNRELYKKLHPANTVKGDFRWRLYCMHRAMEAGIDDVGIGALFGLGDWRYEVLGLLMHAIELEKCFGIGPHTISFPRLVKAHNLTEIHSTVQDDDMKKIVTIIRLSVPYTGMILTARENAELRRKLLTLGVTQTDADSKIGVGAYSRYEKTQDELKQQFILGDTRTLDEVVRELAELGFITSFCTAGYRCGRTGDKIMELLRSGTEGKFCKLNAVLTFKEWLDDFASEKTKEIGEKLIQKEIKEIKEIVPSGLFNEFLKAYNKIAGGERDLYF